jgi:hypothetical protein
MSEVNILIKMYFEENNILRSAMEIIDKQKSDTSIFSSIEWLTTNSNEIEMSIVGSGNEDLVSMISPLNADAVAIFMVRDDGTQNSFGFVGDMSVTYEKASTWIGKKSPNYDTWILFYKGDYEKFKEASKDSISTHELSEALYQSVSEENLGRVNTLLELGADSTAVIPGRDISALHLALRYPGYRTKKILLTMLAYKPNLKEFEEGKNALHLALEYHAYDIELVKLLLELGVSPEKSDQYGDTPIVSSIKKSISYANLANVLKLLFEFGFSEPQLFGDEKAIVLPESVTPEWMQGVRA